jgi:hypothetical protein
MLKKPNDRFKISEAGRLLGSIKTQKKSEASRKNGKLGGRPEIKSLKKEKK